MDSNLISNLTANISLNVVTELENQALSGQRQIVGKVALSRYVLSLKVKIA